MDLNELAIELFYQFDPDQKGYITQEDLSNASNSDSPFSAVQIHSIFTLLDKDQKGVITLSDFTDAFLDVSDANSDENSTSNGHFERQKGCKTSNGYPDDGNVYYDRARENQDDNYENFINKGSDYQNGYKFNTTDTEDFDNNRNNEPPDCENYFHRSSSAKEFTKISPKNPDDYWWEHGQIIDGISAPNTCGRKYSLPLFNKRLNGIKSGSLMKSKLWKSHDNGVNNDIFRKKVGTKSDFVDLIPYQIKHSYCNGQRYIDTSSISLSSKAHPFNNSTKPFNLYNSIKDQHDSKTKHLNKSEQSRKTANISRELDEIFGSKNRKLENYESCRCFSRCESCSSEENLNILQVSKPNLKRNLSQSSVDISHELNRKDAHKLFRSQSSIELHEENDMLYSKKHFLTTKYNNNKTSKSTESFHSQNYLLKPPHHMSVESIASGHDCVPEEWESYLRRIGGVSMFAANHVLRYIWNQIGSFQKELLLPLEDFLKGIIEEHENVYTRCQEVETTLHSKIEQHESEIDTLYEEFDKASQKEISELEKKYNEREESLKNEFQRILEGKDQSFQDNLTYTKELLERVELSEQEAHELHSSKLKVEAHYEQLIEEQRITCHEIDKLTNENEKLKKQNRLYEENIREMQECMNQMAKSSDEEKEKYLSIMRHFKDLLEEKEFLEANISNLSIENVELKNLNDTLALKDDELSSSYFATESDFYCDLSPIKVNDVIPSSNIPRLLSLHEEMSRYETSHNITAMSSIDESGLVMFQDPLSPSKDEVFNNLEMDYESSSDANSLNKKLNDTTECSSFDEAEESQDEEGGDSAISHYQSTSTPKKTSSIRLASAVQTAFKVILCGDCNVGKTSLIHRLCFNKFPRTRQETVTADMYTRIIETTDSKIKLKIWDTVGQEKFNSLPRSYYRKSDVIILVYDMTEESSFVNAKSWFRNIHSFSNDNTLLLLVANKSDVSQRSLVSKERGESLAEENDAMFLEVSAKTGTNVEKLLNMISSTLLDRDETVIIRNAYEHSLCNISYAQRKRHNSCCM